MGTTSEQPIISHDGLKLQLEHIADSDASVHRKRTCESVACRSIEGLSISLLHCLKDFVSKLYYNYLFFCIVFGSETTERFLRLIKFSFLITHPCVMVVL